MSAINPNDPRTDAALIAAVRAGDQRAFAELWRRHSPAALAVARATTTRFDAEDLVQESFSRIYRALLGGSGPESAFRAYLFTTVRNTAAAWGRGQLEDADPFLDEVIHPDSSEEARALELDGTFLGAAFRTLPERWQEVLWYTEVERLSPRELTVVLGTDSNSISALAYRAREGLRLAWVQAHLAEPGLNPECEWSVPRLGSHARGALSARHRERLSAHLLGCVSCSAADHEAREVVSHLRVLLAPLLLGGGAAGYLAWLDLGSSAAVAAPLPATLATDPGAAIRPTTVGTTASVSASAALTLALVVGGAVLAASGVAVFYPQIFGGSEAAAPGGLGAPGPAEPGDSTPPATPSPGPLPGALPAEPRRGEAPAEPLGPGESPLPAAAPLPAMGTPLRPEPTPVPTPTPTSTRVPTPTPTPTSVPSPSPTEDRPSPAPAVPGSLAVDTAGGTLAPILSGSGEPGALLSIHAEANGPALATLMVPGSGLWVSAPVTLTPGEHALIVRQELNGRVSPDAEPLPVTQESPRFQLPETLRLPAIDGRYHVAVTGIPGTRFRLLSAGVVLDEGSIPPHGVGLAQIESADITPGEHTLELLYRDPAGSERIGPSRWLSTRVGPG